MTDQYVVRPRETFKGYLDIYRAPTYIGGMRDSGHIISKPRPGALVSKDASDPTVRLSLSLPESMRDGVESARSESETAGAFIRRAIERELRHRLVAKIERRLRP